MNRNGEQFDWDNSNLADLKAVKKLPTLIHPVIISEIHGVETEDMYDRIIVPIPTNKDKKNSIIC